LGIGVAQAVVGPAAIAKPNVRVAVSERLYVASWRQAGCRNTSYSLSGSAAIDVKGQVEA